MILIDGKNLILGRLASYVAKNVLEGEEVRIFNCQDVVIIGSRLELFKEYKIKKERTTSRKGPFIFRTSAKFVKRAIRGMLPHKRTHGREALKRIKCYKSLPETLKNQKIEVLSQFNVLKTDNVNFVKIGDICKYLGGN